MLSFVRATDILAKSLWIHVDTNLPPQSFISYIKYDGGEQHLATQQFSLTSHVSDSLPGTDFYRAMDLMLSSIELEVTRISQAFPKGVMGHNMSPVRIPVSFTPMWAAAIVTDTLQPPS